MWRLSKYELARMPKQAQGIIIYIDDECAQLNLMFGVVLYAAAKACGYLPNPFCCLEYAAYGVRINAAAPGRIATGMLAKASSSNPERFARLFILMRRLGTLEEVAEAVLWLASLDAPFLTGQVLGVDGRYWHHNTP
jgi:Dehydrogenases with different specificities (related to short-chain alcohol dehydrogenases)